MEYVPIWQRDILEEGIEKGMEKGMEKGANKEKIRIAKEFIKNGIDIAIIARSTGLPLEKVEKLATKVH